MTRPPVSLKSSKLNVLNYLRNFGCSKITSLSYHGLSVKSGIAKTEEYKMNELAYSARIAILCITPLIAAMSATASADEFCTANPRVNRCLNVARSARTILVPGITAE